MSPTEDSRLAAIRQLVDTTITAGVKLPVGRKTFAW
jgi:hypothetical protein